MEYEKKGGKSMLRNKIIAFFMISILSVWFVGCASKKSVDIKPTNIAPEIKNGSIEGGAWFKTIEGGSDLLRGFEIFLCNPDLVGEIEKIRAVSLEKGKDSSGLIDVRGGLLAQDLLDISDHVLSRHKIASVKTDIDGKYKIMDVRLGNYVLYATHYGHGCFCY